MRKKNFPGSLSLLCLLLMLLISSRGSGQVSITTLGSPLTQNFDALSNVAGSTTNNLTITGWFMTETGGGARDNEQYAVDAGASTTGDTYSYGLAASTNRALGQLRSGTLIPNFGAAFTNNTGSTVTSLLIAYTGEQWRFGGVHATVADKMDFQFSTNATSLTTGTWSDIDALDFLPPVTTGVAGALIGDNAANRVALSFTMTGLSIPNGATFWIRWSDVDATGADDGLAVDDFSLTANGATGPTMSASLTDQLLVDNNSNLVANPGDQLRYTTTIRNTSSTVDATGVDLNLAAPTHTTLNPGSTVTSALARNDTTSTAFNTALTTANVITNDFGMPSVTVVSFGTSASLGTTTTAGNAGTTDAGAVLTVNANGTFNYQPPPAFSGTDRFMYIATTGVAGLPNNDALVVITVYPDILFSTTPVNPACNGASTGSITFTGVSGGSGPVYTYSITGAAGTYQASNVFSGLPAGTYNPAVKDGAGNIKTAAAIILTDPLLITFTTTDVNPTCGGSNGSITFNASGGTGTLNYSITGAAGTYQASNVFNGLAAATYNLAVRDANNCIVTGTTTLSGPPPVTFTFNKTDVTCFGAANGTITFNAPAGGTPPYTYSITGTGGTFQVSNSFTGLIPNIYTLVVKDALGCNSATQSTTVTQPVGIAVSGTIPNLTYNVAMATATFTKTGGVGSPANPWSVTGLPTGISINTANGQVTGTPTQTGSFSAIITYTDATGCTGSLTVNFTVAPNLVNNSFNVVGNTQLVSDAHSAPSTPFTASATNIRTNDQADVAIAITAGTFATTGGGSITIDATGRFTYTPPVGSTAADSYVYTGTTNGVSATATINFTIANMIWFVSNTYAGANGASDGRSHRPFTTVNAAASASAANQFIYIHTGSGNTNGDALLKSGQILRGAGSALTVGALSIAAGTKPTLTGMITLANSVSVDGFDMSTGTTTPITSSGATTVSVNIGNVTSSGAANAVTLTNTNGSVTIAGGNQTNTTGATFNINGGDVTLTYSGAITQGANAPMVSVSGGHSAGVITFNTGTLAATNGTGLQFDNADGTYNFNGIATLGGGDAGIDILNGSTGTFGFSSNTSITNPTGTAFNLSGATASNATITYSGSISANAGLAVNIDNHDANTITFQTGNITTSGNAPGIAVNNCGGGTINFNGASISLTSGTNTGVNLTSNSGATISFAPTGAGLDINTSSGNAFNATGGGTINITGTGNSITKSGNGFAFNLTSTNAGGSGINFASINVTGGTGTAVNINTSTGTKSLGDVDVARSGGGTGIFASNAGTLNTTTGTINSGNQVAIDIDNTALGITLQSVSSNGAVNGIDLAITTGSFTITGVSTTAGTGGTIQATTGFGVSLTSAQSVSLSNLNVSNSLNHGINGSAVNGLTLTGCQITNSGNADNEYGMNLSNCTGTLSVNSTTFNGAADNLIYISSTSGTLTANFQNSSQFQYPAGISGTANSAILIEPGNAAVINTTIQNCTFTDIVSASAQFGYNLAASSGTSSFNFSNNIINRILAGRSGGVVISGQENSTSNITINNNNFSGAGGNGVISIDVNDFSAVIGTASGNTITNAPGIGMFLAVDEDGQLDVTVNGNTITNCGGDGIQTVNFGGVGVSTMRCLITNNNINGHSLNTSVNFLGGITFVGFEDNSCLAIRGNTVTGTPPSPTHCGGAPCDDYHLEEVGGIAKLEEIPNTANVSANAAYINSINDPGPVTIFGVVDLTNGALCNSNGSRIIVQGQVPANFSRTELLKKIKENRLRSKSE